MRSLYADLSTDPSENISLRLNMGNMDENSFRDDVSGNRQLFAPSMSWQLTPDLNWLVQYELDSDFDSTYLTGFDKKTNKVTRQHWQQDLTTTAVL